MARDQPSETRAQPRPDAEHPTGTTRASGSPHRRQVLIALNAATLLPRASACRLAATLDDWLGTGIDSEQVARALGLAPTTVETARRLAERATAIAQREEDACRRRGIRVLTLADPDFPHSLLELPQPPPALYCRGRIPELAAIAIVGARRADGYALEAAAIFARSLAASGVVVVSGFARGVDITAHRSALAVDGGSTVAVLGCGLGVDYPAPHSGDRRRIAERGALLSEFPCHEPPRRRNFPIRNRLIAALSAGTLVVQAASRSGSLITARHALELGREIFAIPGPLFDEAWRGSNGLLRDGALLVESAADLLAALPLHVRSRLPDPRRRAALGPRSRSSHPSPAAGAAEELLAHLRPGRPRPAEELASVCGLPIGAALAALLRLELAGLARRHPGGAYSRTPCESERSDGSVPPRAVRPQE